MTQYHNVLINTEEEISLVPKQQQQSNQYAKSEQSLYIQQDENHSVADFLDVTKRSDTDFEAMKAALQSVHPFVPSIFHSEYYFISQKLIQVNSINLGIFGLVLKTFSSKIVKDISQIYSMVYEIECRVIHRQSHQEQNTNYSVFDFNIKQGFQSINIQNIQQIDQQLNRLQISGNTTNQQYIKDILIAHFNLNGAEFGATLAASDCNFQLMSCILDKDQTLKRLGVYDIYFIVRNKLVVQEQIYVIPKFNLQVENLLKNNTQLKQNQYQIIQRIAVKNNITYECLVAPITIELQQINQQLNQFTKPKQVENELQNETNLNAKQQSDDSSEFSYDKNQDQKKKQQLLKQQNQLQVKEVKKQNIFTKLFSQTTQENDLNTFNIQSSRTKKQIQITQNQQYQSQPFITDYNADNLTNYEIVLVNLQLNGGEVVVFFSNQNNFEAQIQLAQQQGVQIEKQFIRVNAKVFSYNLRLVVTRDFVDVYSDNDFLACYAFEGVFVKLLEKGSSVEITEGADL